MVEEISEILRNEKSASVGEWERSGLENYKKIGG